MNARRAARAAHAGLVAVALAACGGPAPGPEPADILLHNGTVFTADDMMSIHSAVAIRGNRIAAVGGEELLQRYRADRVLDLDGRLATPGFIDTHIHVWGDPPWAVDVSHATTIAGIQDLIRDKVAELEPGHWIVGYGWAEGLVAEGRPPYRADLDAAAPDNPVVLSRAGGHSAVGNSRALELAGIDRTTPDPDGGVIEHDARGEPNGIIRERQDLLFSLTPDAGPDILMPGFVRQLKHLLSLGITSIIQAGVPPAGFGFWERAYAENPGALPRATVQIFPGLEKGGATAEEALQRLRDFGRTTGDGNAWLRVGAVKLWVDGGFAGPAAWTLEPYRDQPDYYGIQNISEEDLYTLSRGAHDDGWQLGYHAIGDAAIKEAVDVFHRVLTEAPRQDHRDYVNHFTVVPPVETMRTMAHDNILIAQQPNFTWSPTLESRYVENLDGDRLDHNNPLRTPMSYGIFVALGSDNHPIGPMPGLYASVTRRGDSGRFYAAAEERLTMPEAIAGYTRNGAYFSFEEDQKGTLESGKLADIIVLSDNLLEIPPERILDTQVDLTILDGRIVYERAGQEPHDRGTP